MKRQWKTALIGFGKIAAGYSNDPLMRKHYKYATHIQVLSAHPDFDLKVVVDISEDARRLAVSDWGVPDVMSDIIFYPQLSEIDFLVVAIPPKSYLDILEPMKSLKAILIEKPFATSVSEAKSLLEYCSWRGISVVVNLPRRFDPEIQSLRNGGVAELYGEPQAIFGVYGNGLRNNGTHLIDLILALFGEVSHVNVPDGSKVFIEGPLQNDINISFTLVLKDGISVMVQPISFTNYREVGLDIWAQRGRIQLLNESLLLYETLITKNRQLSSANELSHDKQSHRNLGLSDALYRMYENISRSMHGSEKLLYDGDMALTTMLLIEKIYAEGVAKNSSH